MRILQISSLWPPAILGGAEVYAGRLLKELQAQGHEVRAVTMGVDGPDVFASVPAVPYRLDRFSSQSAWKRGAFQVVDLYNPAASRTVSRAVKAFNPDVVHSHAVTGMSSAVIASSRPTPAHVHHLHDYWLLCRRTTLVRASGEVCEERCGSCQAISEVRSLVLRRRPPDVVIAPSDSIVAAHNRLRWMEDRIRRLDHPTENVARSPRSRPPDGPIIFGFIGQVSRPKGVASLLEAFGPLATEGHRLIVAGQGPLVADVMGKGPGVEALGWIDGSEKQQFFGGIDCLVVPSEWPENAPLTVLEARGHGIPVIASQIGGLPELLDSASKPLLFPAGDVAELRNRMRRFIRRPADFDPLDAEPMGWPEHIDGLLAIYAEASQRAKVRHR